MKQILFCFLVVLTLNACQDKDKAALKDEIVGLEQAYEKEKNPANYLALIAKYNDFLAQYSNDKDLGARYLYRIATLYYENGDKDNALKFLEKNVNEYDHPEVSGRALMLQGTIHQQKGNLTQAVVAFSELVRKYPKHPEAQNAQNAIPSDEKLNNQIENLKKMMGDTTLTPALNRSAYPQLANAYIQFATIHPNDETAPKKLTDAGELYMSVGDAKSAVNAWEKVLENYPNHEMARKAHIQLAFNYENALRDLEKAKELYTSFLEKYPDDEFAVSAEFSLKNLGKSPDEVFENMQKKGE